MVWNGGRPDAYNHPKKIKPQDIKNAGDVIATFPALIARTMSVIFTDPVIASKNPIPKRIIGLPIAPKTIYFKAIS